MKEKIFNGIIGLCVGDALGVPVEFESRESLMNNPVTDMRGYGTYNMPPGTWSDDTSMTLCLVDSLSNGLDYADIMQKFISWIDNAEYTPHGEVFDVGIATRKALSRFADGVEPLLCGGISEKDNGNGSLMRILPLLFYLKSQYVDSFTDSDVAFDIIHNVSSLTHAHKRSQIACGIFLSVADELSRVNGGVEHGIWKARKHYESKGDFAEELKHFQRVFSDDFKSLPEREIRSSGYVVDALEAALWCLLNTDSYESCILKAVNLGEDTDTVAAVAGGLAGMLYGLESIPEKWLNQIFRIDYIKELCEAFYFSLCKSSAERLYSYIPYFENIDPDTAYQWKGGVKRDDGAISVPYPDYDETLPQFIHDVYKSGLMDYNYRDTIERKTNGQSKDKRELIDSADLEFVFAILTYFVRGERFCDGLWEAAVRDGVFLAILRRLSVLLLTR